MNFLKSHINYTILTINDSN